MKIFIIHAVVVGAMPASALLKASGLAAALFIAFAAALMGPSSPPADNYMATIRLGAGSIMCAGSLLLSKAIGETFLRNGGRGAFKALYCASLASTAAGGCEAASAFMAINRAVALTSTAALLSGAGLALIRLAKEVE